MKISRCFFGITYDLLLIDLFVMQRKIEGKVCGRMLAVLLEIEDETKLSPREREKILLFWNYFILSF